MIQVHPVVGIGEVPPGADLPGLLADGLKRSGLALGSSDVLVVTQKIVSKAEGRFVDLSRVTPGAEAHRLAEVTGKDPRFVELVLTESAAVLRTGPNLLIVRHRLGFVMANAGIDHSNIGGGGDRVLLLPRDPDASAATLRTALAAPAVVISDSFGRAWRMGVVNIAIGASGLTSLIDRRGEIDRDGRKLAVTEVAQADQIAAAAGLVMGEAAEGIPAALVRGLPAQHCDIPASALLRPLAQDLFR